MTLYCCTAHGTVLSLHCTAVAILLAPVVLAVLCQLFSALSISPTRSCLLLSAYGWPCLVFSALSIWLALSCFRAAVKQHFQVEIELRLLLDRSR